MFISSYGRVDGMRCDNFLSLCPRIVTELSSQKQSPLQRAKITMPRRKNLQNRSLTFVSRAIPFPQSETSALEICLGWLNLNVYAKLGVGYGRTVDKLRRIDQYLVKRGVLCNRKGGDSCGCKRRADWYALENAIQN
ncbi:hypothetical protein EVAR_41670_1 [Eumeta japonica]|uniref:Uncharacterized protein n=1 Tax=Eumeta variegata TaxID=151549 RepID=A0A4C1VPX5_EUMVA|nr:hypothetical protein EVAR_41670_1 [Eumeta japonica]